MTGNKLQLVYDFCEVKPTSLGFTREVTFEECQNAFNGLKKMDGAVKFWLGDCLNFMESIDADRYKQFKNECGYKIPYLNQVQRVCSTIDADDRSSSLSFRHHIEVHSLENNELRREFLSKAEEENLTIYELRSLVKGQNYTAPSFPKGKYQVIYADPAWKFDNCNLPESSDSHYATMTTEEICDMDVKSLSTKDSVLFLWATNAMLEDALQVCKAWGFKYKSNIVWCKNKGPSIGWFVQSRHELLLICTRENNTHPRIKPPSWHEFPVTLHSKKPSDFYDLIDKMYIGDKIELFARKKREGWESYGNEI